MTKRCFIDTETTGLDRRRRTVWDFACIVRDTDAHTDQEVQFFIETSQRDADPFGLAVGRFWERYPHQPDLRKIAYGSGALVDAYTAARRIQELTIGAVWVGAVPSFDEETCAKLLRRFDLMPRWDYHLVDVETFAAGYLGIEPPWKNDIINAAAGITIPEADRHTALGDARGVRDLYDRIVRLRNG